MFPAIDRACRRALAAALCHGRPAWAWSCDHRRILVPAVVLVVAGAVAWLCMDHSRVLSAREVEGLRAWVVGTQAPSVAEHFNVLFEDGQITLDESGALAETAKAAPVPPGLYQPVVLPE